MAAVDDAAAKRAEIMAKIEAAKEEKEKELAQKASYFGEHPGISCKSSLLTFFCFYQQHSPASCIITQEEHLLNFLVSETS